MWFSAVLIVCSVHAGFAGDLDSGPTCLRFQDRPKVQYATLEECSNRLRVMVESVKADTTKLNQMLPGAWSYKGRCEVPMISEMSR
jgi:hypothetical protein